MSRANPVSERTGGVSLWVLVGFLVLVGAVMYGTLVMLGGL